MNEPKKPYRVPVVRSTYEGVIPAHPPAPKVIETQPLGWTVTAWLIIVVALAVGSCGGAFGATLAWFAKGAVP